MIRNNEDLTIIRTQLTRVEDGLADLRSEVLPHNPENFEILAEGYIDKIRSLRAEIEEYLGLTPIASEMPPNFNSRLENAENAIRDIQQKIGNRQRDPNWINNMIGCMDGFPEFEEIVRYGRELRESDRFTDEVS